MPSQSKLPSVSRSQTNSLTIIQKQNRKNKNYLSRWDRNLIWESIVESAEITGTIYFVVSPQSDLWYDDFRRLGEQNQDNFRISWVTMDPIKDRGDRQC